MDFKQQLGSLGRRDWAALTQQQIDEKIDTTISSTFAWMGWLLLIAFWVAYSLAFWYLPLPFSYPLMMWSWIAWLWLIFFISYRWNKMSYNTIAALLVLFALLEGYWLTWTFLAYDLGNIFNVFLSAWAMFIVLAVIWYRTKIDLTRVWPILMAWLIGLIIAMVINYFLWSTQFDVWISVIGLIIFWWFIIYDMNILKQQALWDDDRVPLLMSLWLFINFINIFLFLLRLTWMWGD